ncbi:hypothetical protein DYB25_000390 [Aphanomyces astaci]|uniref:EF-hand domain-containing protein n=1 Tax=Aphanomyces astaci TaxID=112090 RepID=A0A397B042_APHAT|nr:hypothetical protein DYB36_005546 [Aphanomyces astaci]RHY22813.1 hypothetical protein DYB25_000390 [Aphanomyces astaci]RHY64089.1 hypothetical protein DYB34_000729 [Aphanomyces astaci]RHY70247.1 hypothetical protein DYB30_003845 [Aphanomyces astaci]RHZ24306.1 hypothetical protein DYB31_003418 [Aphanomyces astaci]
MRQHQRDMDSTPLLSKDSEDTLFSASWLVEDAFLCVSRPEPVPTPLARRMYVVHSELAFVGRLVLYALIGLAFVQTPHWCDESKPVFPCGDPSDRSTPMTFQMNYLSMTQSYWIEATCLVLLLANILVPYMYLHGRFLLGLVLVSLLDLTLSAALPTVYAPIASLRLHDYIRIALLITTNTVLRRSLRKILLVLSEIYSILSLVFVFILFYAWMSIVLFSGTPEGLFPTSPYTYRTLSHASCVGDAQMPNMIEASWHFLILLTTSNFPDIMMPAYNANRVTCLFFMLFICFGLFFLMNIVLAVIFNNFARYTEAEASLRHAIRKEKLTQAFQLLATKQEAASRPGGIPLDMCVRMFDELNRCQHVSHIQTTKMHQVFAALDTNGDNEIQLDEFLHTCDVLETLLFADNVSKSEVELWCPVVAHAHWFATFASMIRSQSFEWVVDAALVLNAVLVVIESSGVIYGHNTSTADHWAGWDHFEVAFTTLYVFEMMAKIVIDGTRRYWASVKNRFDCIITVAVVGVDVFTYVGRASPSPQLIKVFLIARCLRLFRLIINIRGYRVIFTTWFRLLQFGMHLLLLLFCHMYIFALLGNQLFGGRISPSVMTTHFPNDPYTQAGYMANNFNDMPSAIVTLFELILVNNWVVIAGGHVAVTSTYARWFFITYYVLGVTFLLNLVVASILDVFLDEYKIEQANNLECASKDDKASSITLPLQRVDLALNKSLTQRTHYGTTNSS